MMHTLVRFAITSVLIIVTGIKVYASTGIARVLQVSRVPVSNNFSEIFCIGYRGRGCRSRSCPYDEANGACNGNGTCNSMLGR
jgi:hypothetical protein